MKWFKARKKPIKVQLTEQVWKVCLQSGLIFTVQFAKVVVEKWKQNRQQIAISLYRKGKVSLGKASQIAGISQEEFIEKLKENCINVFSE